jgi:2-keto-4-pentenoate hydratase/2-oxohepta-3-ene-1,7-dioic acid hydratase in catechol pathway
VQGEGDDLVAAEVADHPFGTPTFTGSTWPMADVRVLAPILPSKVVGVELNYSDRARELGRDVPAEPEMFLRPSTTVSGPGAPIKLPTGESTVEFGGGLAVVIGQPCRDVPVARARDVVLGYTIAGDVTGGGQLARARSHDTFCPLGPWIRTDADPADLDLRTEVDGTVTQDASTAQLVHEVPELVAWVSAVMTLLPGDVILTGTPAGVAPVRAGQTVSVTIDGLGTLSNPVASR